MTDDDEPDTSDIPEAGPAFFARANVVADLDLGDTDTLAEAAVRFLYDLRDRLPMFVVYDRPADFPEHVVARLWVSHPPTPIRFVVRARTLDPLRDFLERLGLIHLSRAEADDPSILETWV